MSWLDQFDLTRRWAGRMPRWLIEAAVALAMTALGILPRLAIESAYPNVVPYALIYPAVLFATLLAGFRAGLIALLLSQLLAMLLFVSPKGVFAFERTDDAISLAATTLAQLLIVIVVTGYRRASRQAARLEQERADTLALALRELDHRTKNNFMLAAALLRIQAARSDDAKVAAALEDASNRLLAIEGVQSNLAVSSEDIAHVSLAAYLGDLCERLRQGLFAEHVELECEVEDVALPRDVAVPIGLIVNELIANALKHAFDERGGRIAVRARPEHGRVILEVADDGRGRAQGKGEAGVGTRLVTMLTMRLNATLEELAGPGTRYRISLPLADAARR